MPRTATANAPASPRAAKSNPRATAQRGAGGEGLAHEQSGTPTAEVPAPSKDRHAIIARPGAPTFVKSVQASLPTTWEADEWGTSAAPYIPTPTIGNPLGIRPSSLPKPLPKGPRALNAAPAPKKPVVVGAKWSAVRSAGSSATGSSLGGISASSSSSSVVSSILTSPALAAKPVLKTSLSEMLGYMSPSPPPPPPPAESPPQLPPPPPRFAPTFQKVSGWSPRAGGSSSPTPPDSYQKSPVWTPPAAPVSLPSPSKAKSTSGWDSDGAEFAWSTDNLVPLSMSCRALTPNPYCVEPSMSCRAITPNPYCDEPASMAFCAPTPAAMSHDLMPTPSARPTAFNSDSAMWTPEASPPLLFQGNNTSRKRAYEEWKNENYAQSMVEHAKRIKTDESASPGSSSSYTAHASISAPSSSLVSMVPAPPQDSNVCRSPATYVRPYYAKESGSWSTKVIVPIPKGRHI